MARIAFIIIILVSFSGNTFTYADLKNNFSGSGATWELTGGYSLLTGYYGSYFSSGYHFAFAFSYPMYSFLPFMAIGGEISASSREMSQSEGSLLNTFSARGGVIIGFPSGNMAVPYLGLFLEGASMMLEAEHLQEQGLTYKPGFILKTGLMFMVNYGVGIKAGIEYETIRLSGKYFIPITFTLSATFNYASYLSCFKEDTRSGRDENESVSLKIKMLQEQGMREMKEGNIRKAVKSFGKIVELDPDYKLAADYLDKLIKYENNYKRALKLIAVKKYFDAIPILVELSGHMNDARYHLVRVRKILAPKILDFEKNGISAYEDRQYDRCIIYMKKIKLIDPGNKIAEIYLPRSIKRKRAIEKLR